MAMHTQNLVGDPRASLFVTVPEAKDDPLGTARLTVIGKASKVPKAELKGVREAYLSRHENASRSPELIPIPSVQRPSCQP